MRETTRRDILTGMGALALGAALGRPARAQQGPRLIDTHHHIYPPAYAKPNIERLLKDASALPASAYTGWTPNFALEQMDKAGVATAIVSMTSPGVWFDDGNAAGRKRARICNEYGAGMKRDHPGRFGIFAAIPLPDTEGSLREIEYALDHLKADGIGLLTSYGDAWLGDEAFAPVFEELNRRKAVVYTHPTAPECCRNLATGVPPPILEYGTDTSRAVAKIVFGGAARRYPDIRFIFSHAGGTVPFLLERFVVHARSPGFAANLPDGVEAVLRRFYYDTAQAAMAPPMAALRLVAPVSQILFGTDYPYRTAAEHADELRQSRVFNADEIAAIERGNALALLKRDGISRGRLN